MLPLLELSLLRRSFPFVLAIVGLGVVGLTLAKVVQTISDAKPVPSALQATSIVWSGRVFQTPAELAHWLRSQGATYTEWRRRHPVDAALLEHRRMPATPLTGVHQSRVRATPPAGVHRSRRAEAAGRPGDSLVRQGLVIIIALLAAACAFAALLPPPILRRFPTLARAVVPHRDLLLAGAAAIVTGLAVAMILG